MDPLALVKPASSGHFLMESLLFSTVYNLEVPIYYDHAHVHVHGPCLQEKNNIRENYYITSKLGNTHTQHIKRKITGNPITQRKPFTISFFFS
jgi:hypothetical protein